MLPSQSSTKNLPRRWSPINHLLPYGIRGVDRGEPQVKLEPRSDQVILNEPDSSEGALKRRFPEMTRNYQRASRDQPTSNSLKRIHLEHRAGTEPVAPSINVAFSNPFASSRPRSMVPLRAAIPSHVRRVVDVEPISQARSPSRQTPPFDGPNQGETDDIPHLASDIVDQPLSTLPEPKIITLRSGKKLPRALIEDWSSSSSDGGAIEGSRLRDSEQLRRNAYSTRRRAIYADTQMPQKALGLGTQANVTAPRRCPGSVLVDGKPKFAKGKRRVKQDGYSMTPNAIDHRKRKDKESDFEQRLGGMIDQDIVAQVEAEGWLTPKGRLFKAGIRMMERVQQEHGASSGNALLATAARDTDIDDLRLRFRKLTDDKKALEASIAEIGWIVAKHSTT